MKKLVLILPLLLFIISCKKVELPNDQSALLIGKWDHVLTTGGYTGGEVDESSYEIEYTENGKYKNDNKKLLKFNDRFEFVIVNSIYTRTNVYAISYRKMFSQSFTISNDTLFLKDEVRHSYSSIYTRK